MLLRSCRTYITCMVALCAIFSSTVLLLGAGIAAACEGTGGGGGCSAPSVSTGGYDSLTSNSVTLTGSVNPQGCYTEYAFEYGRSSEGYPDEIYGSAGSGTSSVSVSTSSAIVQPSTTYHYRLSAWSEGGEVTGGSGSFTTPAACPAPTVTTDPASSVTASTARLNGRVNPNGCSTEYTFEYGLAASGTYTKVTGSAGSGTGTVSVWKDVSGLQAGKMYTFRLSAKNSKGTTNGSFLYFTTEAAPTDYVALGDSYSSGTGAGPYFNYACWRSEYSYPYLYYKAYSGGLFYNEACHGATTTDLINSQVSNLNAKTKWVTYTIGGNDAWFGPVVSACASPFVSETTCYNEIHKSKTFIQGTLGSRLDAVNNTIKSRAKNAKVIVFNYPRLFNGTDCNSWVVLSTIEMSRMNELADIMKGVIHAAATRAGSNFIFRDVIPKFVGHAVCDGGEGSATEWINGHSTPEEESYHPKKAGHREVYYELLRGVTG